MRIGCATLVLRIALAKEKGAPKKLFCGKQTTAMLHVINLGWTKAPFCVTGYVNTDLSCLWLGFDLAVIGFLTHAFDLLLFPPGGFFHLHHTSRETIFIKLKPQ